MDQFDKVMNLFLMRESVFALKSIAQTEKDALPTQWNFVLCLFKPATLDSIKNELVPVHNTTLQYTQVFKVI